MKAKALSGLERTEEALKEFLYCVALNPEWSSMKKEAQKVQNVFTGYLAIVLLLIPQPSKMHGISGDSKHPKDSLIQ